MKLPRRRAVLADFSRPRVGLSERQVQACQRPETGRVTMLGAIGLTSSYRDPSPSFDEVVDRELAKKKFIVVAVPEGATG
jgi:hypothetical protein